MKILILILILMIAGCTHSPKKINRKTSSLAKVISPATYKRLLGRLKESIQSSVDSINSSAKDWELEFSQKELYAPDMPTDYMDNVVEDYEDLMSKTPSEFSYNRISRSHYNATELSEFRGLHAMSLSKHNEEVRRLVYEEGYETTKKLVLGFLKRPSYGGSIHIRPLQLEECIKMIVNVPKSCKFLYFLFKLSPDDFAMTLIHSKNELAREIAKDIDIPDGGSSEITAAGKNIIIKAIDNFYLNSFQHASNVKFALPPPTKLSIDYYDTVVKQLRSTLSPNMPSFDSGESLSKVFSLIKILKKHNKASRTTFSKSIDQVDAKYVIDHFNSNMKMIMRADGDSREYIRGLKKIVLETAENDVVLKRYIEDLFS